MFSKKLAVLEQERQALKVELERQQVDFQQQQQRKQGRREFDLSDPEGLKKSLPARVGDDDPRCGPSSLQKCGRFSDSVNCRGGGTGHAPQFAQHAHKR